LSTRFHDDHLIEELSMSQFRSGLVLCIGTLLFTILTARPALADPAIPSVADSPLEVKLADVALRNRLLLLSLGNVVLNKEYRATLIVSPVVPEFTSARAFCEGRFLHCNWIDSNGGSRADRAVKLGTGRELQIVFKPLEAVAEGHSILLTDEKGKVITFVLLDYALFKQSSVELELKTPRYASGLGEDWGPWYQVCSGAAPSEYSYKSNSFSVSGDDGRGCTAWVNCEAIKADSTDVCYRFQVQGKEAKFPDGAETKHAEATLKVRWDLIEAEPRLLVPPSGT
jgi:hypothetical protein